MADYRTPRTRTYSSGGTHSAAARQARYRASRRKRGRLPAVIIAGIILFLILCWVFGRGCGGDKEAQQNEELRKYVISVNKTIARSSAVGNQFDELRKEIASVAREDVDKRLSEMAEECKRIAKDSKKIVLPKKAEDIHPLLEVCFDMRTEGIGKFRTSILEVIDEKATEKTEEVMSDGLLDLVISDAMLARFRTKLESKLTALKLSYEKVADSRFVQNEEEALPQSVSNFIKSLSSPETGNEIHGVAIIALTTSPQKEDSTSSGVSILPKAESFSVKVTVENQGNQEEKNIPVVAKLTTDTGASQVKTKKIAKLEPKEKTVLVFEGLKPEVGAEAQNTLTVEAGPVRNEKKTDNNKMTLKFIMKSQ
ncbi:MAG: hypothetical protein PHO53_04650 [Actinomycetota bacterium]|nr:hypothetical protein [Actinomycetota bacterium]